LLVLSARLSRTLLDLSGDEVMASSVLVAVPTLFKRYRRPVGLKNKLKRVLELKPELELVELRITLIIILRKRPGLLISGGVNISPKLPAKRIRSGCEVYSTAKLRG